MCLPCTGTSLFLLTPSCLASESTSRTTDIKKISKPLLLRKHIQDTESVSHPETFRICILVSNFWPKQRLHEHIECTIPLISPPRITDTWPNLHRSSENQSQFAPQIRITLYCRVNRPMSECLEAFNTLLFLNQVKYTTDGKLHRNLLPQYIRKRIGKKGIFF